MQSSDSSVKEQPLSEAPSEDMGGYIEFKKFNFFYGQSQALFDVDLGLPKGEVVALIGPSGCGKSTLLRSINRMNELIDNARFTGDLLVDGRSVYDPRMDVNSLRKRIGMVFQKTNPFPKSIYDNVVFSLRMSGLRRKSVLDEVVESSLRKAFLWGEVKDRLKESALELSGGQMQRLCIARAIANAPEIILMDEPCSALDPIATNKIEDLIDELKKEFTIVIVTHNLQQASRISDKTAFFYMGKLVEYDKTSQLFLSPGKKQTEDYITGKFG